MLRFAALATLASVLAAGPAGAQAEKPVLTVYTYSSFAGEYGPGATVKERFEAVCDCTLNWVSTDDAGALLSRLKLEGQSTEADVVLGLDTNLMAEAKATGLFAPHQADISALDVPIEWTDDTFVPFDWGWFAFVYDKTRLPTPPASMKELVDNERGPKIIIQDPRTSTPGLGLMLWMKEIYGDQAAEAWEKLRPRIVTVSKGWSEGYGLFVKGESDMVLSYTTSPAYHIGAEQDDKYAAAPFAEGHYLQVEVGGLIGTSDQQELGRKFLSFVLSDDFQSAIPETNWMYPAKTPASGLPESFSTLVKPEKTLLRTPEDVAENRRAWTDEWLDGMSR